MLLIAALNRAPQPRRLVILPRLLQRVHGIADQALKALDPFFPRSDGRVMTRPLAYERPRSAVVIQQLLHVGLARASDLLRLLLLSGLDPD